MKNIQKKYGWLMLMLCCIAVIYASTLVRYKIDVTKEKRYTLSPVTKEVFSNLEDDISIEVLLTGNLNSGFKKLSLATEDLLQSLRDYSKGKLHFVFKKPGEGLSDTARTLLYDSLVGLGVKPFNNQITKNEGDEKTEQLLFPAAIVQYQGKVIAVDLMGGKSGQDEESSLNYSEALLEFKFNDAVNKLTRKQFPVVAYAAGNGEPINGTVKDLIDLMRNNYRFGFFDMAHGTLNVDSVQALMIVKPSKPFSDNDKLKIDQYIMQGGKVIWFVDKLEASFDSLLRSKADFVAFDKGLNIDELLFKYGVRINNDLLQDLNCAKQPLKVGESGGQPQIERIPFPYYPLLSSPSNHPIAKNLDHVLSVFPSSLDTVKAAGITKTVLLATDTNSRTLNTPAIVSLNSVKSQDDIKTFNKSFVPVAVLLEGKFNSFFTNRLTPAAQDTVKNLTGVPFIANAGKASQQIVVSNAALVTNVITQSQGPLPMGTQQFENYQFANREFLLNCMDYLVGNAGILQTRSKDFTLRLLNKTKIREQKNLWQGINLILPVVLVLLFGAVLLWRRKEKFAG